MDIFQEKYSDMVVIQKIISHMDNCLLIIKCTFQTRQYAKCKAIEKLGKEIKKLKVNVNNFIIRCVQLTFTSGKNKILFQSFDYISFIGENYVLHYLYKQLALYFYPSLV